MGKNPFAGNKQFGSGSDDKQKQSPGKGKNFKGAGPGNKKAGMPRKSGSR